MATETVDADARPVNPTPARIKAARLLKQLNADDGLTTAADVEALAALDPDDYRGGSGSHQHHHSISIDRVAAAAIAAQFVKARLWSDTFERVGYFGPHADSRALAVGGDVSLWDLIDSHCSWRGAESSQDEEPLPPFVSSRRRRRA